MKKIFNFNILSLKKYPLGDAKKKLSPYDSVRAFLLRNDLSTVLNLEKNYEG